MSRVFVSFSLLLSLSSLFPGRAYAAGAAEPVDAVRLYALDCGTAEFSDMSILSDAGEYDGKAGKLVIPCFLIRHPKGNLLWDTGLGDELAKKPGGMNNYGIHFTVARTLVDQLKALGLTPADIEYVGFSHFHSDHTGNAKAFLKSTWLVNRREAPWALSKPAPIGVDPQTLTGYARAKKQLLDSLDYDVFGDGTVKILYMPGHTPGHQSLMLRLPRAGVVILSGDLYHTRDNYKNGRVQPINYSRADTLASFDRLAKLMAHYKARLVIQHDADDFAALPKLPAFLE